MNAMSSHLKGQIRQTLILSLITICVAQINLHIFTETFTISLATVCLPAFMYLLDDVAILPLSLLSGFGIFGSRVLIHAAQTGSASGAADDYMPEIIFYFALGLLLFLFDHLIRHRRKLLLFIPGVMCIDYLSNALELFARIQTASYSLDSQLVLIVVAGIRGLILTVVLASLNRYRVMLLTRTHAERYQRLIMLISRLKGETVWMDKNAAMIEETMNTSYALYTDLLNAGGPDSERQARQALSVAKDVHEIKKEYILIQRGLSEAMQSETESDGMLLTEIFTILTQSVRDEYADSGRVPLITMESENRLYTREPYLFLSIFHNLITNAVEAAQKRTCAVSITETEGERSYIFTVHDNGPGIPIKYRDRIFSPRFSTKVNYETGAVNRGLGLCIVKDMVEQNLGGTIRLSDAPGGAAFVITIPKERMEEAT